MISRLGTGAQWASPSATTRSVPELSFTDAELDRLADAVADRVRARLPDPAQGTVNVPVLLSVSAAGRVLGVSPDTVRRRIAEGALPALHEADRTVVRGDELRSYIDGLERIGQRPGRAPRAPARRRYDFLHERSTSLRKGPE